MPARAERDWALKTLTDRQRQILGFISAYIDEHKHPPAVRDLASHFTISKGGLLFPIVVAMFEQAVTLKGLYLEKSRARLEAENPDYPSIFPQNVRIVGKLSAIVQAY